MPYSFTTPRNWVYDAELLATQLNEQIRDNERAIWVGTTAGDMDYYSGSTTKDRIAIGAAGKILQSDGSKPVWKYPELPCFCMTNTGTQVIALESQASAIYNTENKDSHNFADLAVSTTYITIPSGLAGYYELSFSAAFNYGDFSSYDDLVIQFRYTRSGATTVIGGQMASWTNAEQVGYLGGCANYYLEVGDIVDVLVKNYTGVAITIGYSLTRFSGMRWA